MSGGGVQARLPCGGLTMSPLRRWRCLGVLSGACSAWGIARGGNAGRGGRGTYGKRN